MEEALAHLRGARPSVGAADVDVALLLGREGAAALRACRGHDERALAAVAHLDDRAEDLGDDIACFAEKDHVADEHALARYLLGVVQGCHGDGGTRDQCRLHDGEGRHAAGAPDVDLDVAQAGAHDLGGVLVGDSPAGSPRGRPEALLDREVVDLDDDAIDLMLDVVTVLAVVGDVLLHAGQIRHEADPVACRQAEAREDGVGLTQRREGHPLVCTDAVHDQAQCLEASCGECELIAQARQTCLLTVGAARARLDVGEIVLAAVDALAQAAGRCVARIGER